MKAAANSFDLILNTIPSEHDYTQYTKLTASSGGKHIILGLCVEYCHVQTSSRCAIALPTGAYQSGLSLTTGLYESDLLIKLKNPRYDIYIYQRHLHHLQLDYMSRSAA